LCERCEDVLDAESGVSRFGEERTEKRDGRGVMLEECVDAAAV